MTRRLCLLFTVATVCFAQPVHRSFSAKDYGAKGDGVADDTGALQMALDTICAKANPPDGPTLYVPPGTYNINATLVTRCSMTVVGAGPAASIIFQTVHRTLNHGIEADFPLRLQDISIDTAPLMANFGMIAVISVPPPAIGPRAQGHTFTFLRFSSSGFNFGLDINGTGDEDLLQAIIVKNCDISVSTETNAVSAPINVANAEFLSVEDSTLTGDQKNDHAIYAISIRKVLIENNLMDNHDNSAIKLLAGGFGPTAVCPADGHDYSTWTVANNVIKHSKLALAAYTYCAVELQELTIAGNLITDIPNTYRGDTAAMYIQATCQSAIDKVTMKSNTFRDIGLSGVFLLSSVEASVRGKNPCADPAAQGTIRSFSSTADTFINWSISYPEAFAAITASGAHLLHASVSELRAEGRGHGRVPLNLAAFSEVTVHDLPELVKTEAAR